MSDKVNKFLMANGIVVGENAAKQYGVLGMKWGVRKSRADRLAARGDTSSSANTKPSKQASTPARRSNTFRAKPQNRRMSDAELRAKLNRLQMEKQLKDLTATPKAKSFMRELLVDVGKQTARDVANRAAKTTIQLALDSAAKNAKSDSTKLFLTAMAAQGKKKGGK